jgi:8-oxo-dGTP pyrophosphatase MutT (NUDIX family)
LSLIAEPRLAATVLLVRDCDGLEVLMVERHEQAYFAAALVFPGGIVDPADHDDAWLDLSVGARDLNATERALRIAGYRELYEETGVLLVDHAGAPARPPADDEPFLDRVSRLDARLDLRAMHPFAHWITPEASPKRYDTHFRLCGLATGLTPVSDGRETVSVEWLRPRDALALGAAGERKLLFPTRVNLELLARASSVDHAIAQAAERSIFTVTPRVEQRPEGVFVTIPPDTGYGAAEEFVGPPRGR